MVTVDKDPGDKALTTTTISLHVPVSYINVMPSVYSS